MAESWDVYAGLRGRYQSFDNLDFDSSVDNNSSKTGTRLYIKPKRYFDVRPADIVAMTPLASPPQDEVLVTWEDLEHLRNIYCCA